MALPAPSVVTSVAPRNVAPSPLPDASQAVLPKNSIRNVAFGVLLSVPWRRRRMLYQDREVLQVVGAGIGVA